MVDNTEILNFMKDTLCVAFRAQLKDHLSYENETIRPIKFIKEKALQNKAQNPRKFEGIEKTLIHSETILGRQVFEEDHLTAIFKQEINKKYKNEMLSEKQRILDVCLRSIRNPVFMEKINACFLKNDQEFTARDRSAETLIDDMD